MGEHKGHYSRGYLPHLDIGQVPQFLTWRLADSLPAQLIERWRQELQSEPEQHRKREMYRRVESFLDSGAGKCVLRNPVAARIVQEAIVFYHGKLYQLHGWVVMPNHVHVLATPVDAVKIGTIPQRIKSYTSKEIHRCLDGDPHVWQADYFDRAMRDENHFGKTLKYIEWNPVKARLCTDPARWPWSSADPANQERLLQ